MFLQITGDFVRKMEIRPPHPWGPFTSGISGPIFRARRRNGSLRQTRYPVAGGYRWRYFHLLLNVENFALPGAVFWQQLPLPFAH